MRWLFLLFLFPVTAFAAVAKDVRICDCEGDCAKITSTGQLMVSSTNDNTSAQNCDSTQEDVRISDNQGDVAKIVSGTLQTA